MCYMVFVCCFGVQTTVLTNVLATIASNPDERLVMDITQGKSRLMYIL